MPNQPAPKRQKLSLFATTRVRNGGSPTSFLTPSNITAGSPTEDDGSDTEEEDNTELEEEYLNKMTDDTDRPIQTVFGEGVEVWTSHGGTTYTDLNDKVKRLQREKEIWTPEARAKVAVGTKRKHEEIKVKEEKKELSVLPKGPAKDDGEEEKFDFTPILTPAHPSNPNPPTTPYPPRSPTATRFHHSSAGIDPLGAHNRPIAPLPSRARIVQDLRLRDHKGPEGTTAPHPSTRQLFRKRGYEHTDGVQRLASPPASPAAAAVLAVAARPRRIVSGSFGSFEGVVSRFDERGYRLGRGAGERDSEREGNGNGNGKGKEGKLDPFKGRPWLRR